MSRKFLLLLPFAILPLDSLSAAVVYYAQAFPNGTGGNLSHGSANWKAHIGTSATTNTTNTANGSGFVIPNTMGGYGAKANTGSSGIAWTENFAPIDLSLTQIESLSFRSNNGSADVMKFAVRIDSQWYVTTQSFTHNGGAVHNDWSTAENEIFSFGFEASKWQVLNFTADSTLSVGSVLSSNLPAGSFTAAGIYLPSNSGIIRYDDFTINVVPEPSAAALVVAGLAGITLRRRRSA